MSTTRRALLRGALAGGAAVGALALDSQAALADVPALLRGARGDSDLLFRLLQYEQTAAFAYAYVERSVALSTRAKGTVTRFLGHERSHAQLLTAAMAARHETPYAPKRGVAAADRMLSALGVSGRLQGARHQDAAVRLLISVETAGENIYYGAIERLSSPALLNLAAEILACEGQHWSGLSGLLQFENPGRNAPHAFVPLVGQFSG